MVAAVAARRGPQRLRAVLANDFRVRGAEPFDRTLGPLCIGAGLIPDGLQLGNAILQHQDTTSMKITTSWAAFRPALPKSVGASCPSRLFLFHDW